MIKEKFCPQPLNHFALARLFDDFRKSFEQMEDAILKQPTLNIVVEGVSLAAKDIALLVLCVTSSLSVDTFSSFSLPHNTSLSLSI